MVHELAGVVGAGFWVVVLAMWVAGMVVVVALPFTLFSLARNVRGIRAELARLNETLEARDRTRAGGVLGI